MNILYINHYAGTPSMGMEFRPYYLSREWIKKGHNVRIVAGDFSHLRQNNPSVNKDFETKDIDGIKYTWVKTGSYEGNGIARAMTMFRFVAKLWINAKKIAKEWQPDVIITSSTYPLDTFAGQRIRKYSGAKLIHEVHDMWPITLMELGGMKKYNPFVVLMQIGENSFCKNSDYVVSLLCAAKDYFVKHGMEPEKFININNGVVLEEWESPEDLPSEHQLLLNELHDNNKFVICFFGSITKSYALDYLIEASKKTRANNVAIVFVGEGNQKDELINKTRNRKDIYFLPRIPKKAIPSLMKNIDCCYVGALKNDMFRFGISMNKLYDSMMSGNPILYAVDAPNNYIEDYNCGISVPAENVDALANGIEEMCKLSPKERKIMANNGRNAIINFFTYKVIANQFNSLFNKDK